MSATSLWKNNTQVLTCTLGTIKEKQQSQKPLVLLCFKGTEVKKNLYQKKGNYKCTLRQSAPVDAFKDRCINFQSYMYADILHAHPVFTKGVSHGHTVQLFGENSFWCVTSAWYLQI